MKNAYYITDTNSGRVEELSTFEEAIRARERFIADGIRAELEIEPDRQSQGHPPRTLAEIEREVGLFYQIETAPEEGE